MGGQSWPVLSAVIIHVLRGVFVALGVSPGSAGVGPYPDPAAGASCTCPGREPGSLCTAGGQGWLQGNLDQLQFIPFPAHEPGAALGEVETNSLQTCIFE